MSSANQEISDLTEPEVNYCIRKRPPPVPMLRQSTAIQLL